MRYWDAALALAYTLIISVRNTPGAGDSIVANINTHNCGLMRGHLATKKRSLKFKNHSKSTINKQIKFKTLKQMLKSMETMEPKYYACYNTISTRPKKKICDITGLPAKYTCPRTNLNFYDLSVYEEICDMRHETIDKIRYMKNYGQELNVFKRKY